MKKPDSRIVKKWKSNHVEVIDELVLHLFFLLRNHFFLLRLNIFYQNLIFRLNIVLVLASILTSKISYFLAVCGVI